MVSVTTHDEDIELEDKSILLTAQRKHFTNFSFGHNKTKSFQSNQNYAKQLTAKSQIPNTKPKTGLDNVNLVDELMESLPQWRNSFVFFWFEFISFLIYSNHQAFCHNK